MNLALLGPKIIAAACTKSSFFFFPVWWEYLSNTQGASGGCNINFSFPGDIWLVGLAIIDILLRLAGIIAVVGIMIGGVNYMAAGGNPEKAASARKRIYNTLGGLAIVMLATVIVTFVGKKLGG